MSDSIHRGHDSMYCHGCHHQWQREGESIECPACRSASTEIISSDDDPRRFHGRGAESAPAPPPVYGPERPPAGQTSTPNRPAPNRTTQDTHATTHGPTITHQFIFAPSVTFYTIVPDHGASQGAATQGQPAQGPQPLTWFGMHFFTPRSNAPPPPPSGTNSPPAGSTEGVMSNQPQTQDGQQQHSDPMSAGMPGGFMAALLASMFHPAGAMMFGGDAVYSQEAFDRIITQLREANANAGGAPPASQSALDKLQTKEVDDEMLGACDRPKCVICVDEMVKGDKASMLPCSHFFHGDCITPWLKQHNTCPVCRRSIEEVQSKPKAMNEFQAHHAQHEHHENAHNATGCV